MAKISRVLLSVTDKTGILEFASALAAHGRRTHLHRRHRAPASRRRRCRRRCQRRHRISRNAGWPRQDHAPQNRRRHPRHARQRRTHGSHTGARHRPHRHGGGQPLPLRGSRRQGRRPPRGTDREHRHRRAHHDPRRRQELSGRRRRHRRRKITPQSSRNCARPAANSRSIPNGASPGRSSAPPPITIPPSARASTRSTLPASLPASPRHPRAQADGPALRRESASVRRAVRRARPGNRRRRATAGQGTHLQQPGGSRRRLATGQRVRRAPPWPSSSTPIPAAAPSRTRSPKPIARPSKPIRSRPSAA